MSNHDIDTMVEKLLGEKEPYIDDAGFTQKVMVRLPATGIISSRSRSLIILSCAAIAALIISFVSGLGTHLVQLIGDICTIPSQNHLPQISTMVVVGLAAWGIAAVVREAQEEGI